MRNRIFAWCTLGVIVACNSYGGDESSDPGTNPGQNPAPPGSPENPHPGAPPAPEVTPPESELTEKYGYFVAPSGSDENDGTRARPLQTISAGLVKAKVDGKRVYVCAGKYTEALTLENAISMIGGYDCSGKEWKNGPSRTQVASPTSPAIRAKDIVARTRVELFDVSAPNATEPSGSSIGLIAENATQLTIVNTRIIAGSGAPGTNGSVTGLTDMVTDAALGLPEGRNCSFTPGGACAFETNVPADGAKGGLNTCLGKPGIVGGPGGKGGSGAVWQSQNSQVGRLWFLIAGSIQGEARTGAIGASGQDGTSAAAATNFSADGYVPANGTMGTDGLPGEGGAGGDGQAPVADASAYPDQRWHGPAGGGGGAGGCPGVAGSAGTGGGASVTALLFGSPISFERCELQSGNGGQGGRGTFPSAFTYGQPGKLSGNGFKGAGELGGAGGRGGVSGAGAGGPSLVIAQLGAEAKLVMTTTDAGRGGSGRPAETLEDRSIPASGDGASVPLFKLGQ